MMLQELCHLAERENLVGDPAFEMCAVEWIVNLTATGEMIGDFAGTHQEIEQPRSKAKRIQKKNLVAKRYLIPRQFNPKTGAARSGTKPYAYFLVDKCEYVFGCSPGAPANTPASDEWVIRCHNAFLQTLRACLLATDQPEVKAVITFLEKVRAVGLPRSLPESAKAGDYYGFVVRPAIDVFVHELPAIQDYWRSQCALPVSDNSALSCLVSGHSLAEPKKVPLIPFPGITMGIGLVSFNKPAFKSYGWDSNDNAPISADAAQAVSMAMNRLLDPAFQTQDGRTLQKRHIRLSNDTVACYWANETAGDELADHLQAGLQADPSGKAGELWRAAWRGKPPDKLDPTRFFAFTLTGAQGRAIVRDWYETTVGEVQASVAEYFAQLDLVPNTRPGKGKDLPPQYSIRTIQDSLVASGKADDLPSKFATELFGASINHRHRFPSFLLATALERMRADAGKDEWIDSYRRDARTGLIKAILIRNYRHMELTPIMNEEIDKPAYLLGRLFACIERMQYLALDQVNANVTNRYFAAASTTPRLVFPPLLRDLEGHYFKKAQRKKPKGAWKVRRHVSEIQTLYGKVMNPNEGYPPRFSPVDQGLFMIGYHTQRGLYISRPENKDGDALEQPTANDPDDIEQGE